MKPKSGLVAMFLLGLMGCATHPPLKTAEHVDLARYAGRWYEIARFPHWYERGCTAVTAEYRLLDDGRIEVVNSCRKGSLSGPVHAVKGTARVVDPATNARLKVRFGWLAVGGYWILALAPDYSYAVVGTPDRRSLWILSRAPRMDPALYERLVTRAAALGFDTRRLARTEQPPGQADRREPGANEL